MTIEQIVVLAVVQGITEFLPISSSGHLILIPQLMHWPDQGILVDVMTHFGTLPVLLTDAHGTIAGAYAISEYLGDTADERSGVSFQPFPGDAAARAEARRLTDWFHRKFFDEVTSYLVEEKVYRRFGPQSASPDMEAMRAGRNNLRYHLTYIGHLAETRSWLAGDGLSFADLAAAAHLSTLDFLGEVSWEEYEPAKNWYALLKSRPSFRPLLQDRVAGFTPAGSYADLDF